VTLLAVYPNTCDVCCLGRGKCRTFPTSQIPGSCCPHRSRCCLTGPTSQVGAYSCCAGAETCQAIPTVPGESRCSLPQLQLVPVDDDFHCPVCCLGQGNCASIQQTAGSCCDKGDTCCLQGDIPRMAGAYTCCRSNQACARTFNEPRQCVNVDYTPPTCTNCCLGSDKDACDGLRSLKGSCCQADETCCHSEGKIGTKGSYVCCKSRTETCVRTDSGVGSCIASELRPTPAPAPELCQGRDPLEDPVQKVTLSCGLGERACPGSNSYCDTKNVFPSDPYRGICCPYEPVKRKCARADDCKECAKKGCVWIEDGAFCHDVCPANYLECVTEKDQCSKSFSWILGSCFRRCGEVGKVRWELELSLSQTRSGFSTATSAPYGSSLFGPSQQMAGAFGPPSSWISPYASPFSGPRLHICSCDFLCELLGDCCDDYSEYCQTLEDL
jgi:hypothetical protein